MTEAAVQSEHDASTAASDGARESAAHGPSWPVIFIAMAAAMLVMLARGAHVVHVTSETIDEPFHLMHGLSDWTNYRQHLDIALRYNDPPLGGMLVALPLYLAGGSVQATVDAGLVDPQRLYNAPVLWGQHWKVDTMRHAVAAWKAALMLPGLGAAFCWAWRLYGRAAAWLVLLILLFDPTIAAYLPQATLDTVGTGMILWAAYLVWRYVGEPTTRRLLWASFAVAVAMTTKHTAIVMPAYAVLATMLVWPWVAERHSLRGAFVHAGRLALAAGLVLAFIWPLTKFDISPPAKAYGQDLNDQPTGTPWEEMHTPDWAKKWWPAGVYIGSVLEGQRHNKIGHKAYLLGEKYGFGRWDFFPIVATYKVPLGFAAIALLGLASFAWRRPRLMEGPLILAVILWWLLICSARVNIGWRHAMPAFALTMLLCCRVVAADPEMIARTRRQMMHWLLIAVSFAAAGAAAIDVTLWHPNYVPYTNFTRQRPAWQDISDSNIDFGQAIKQTGWWLDEHAAEVPQPIYFMRFGGNRLPDREYLGDRVIPADRLSELPREGTLIISPVNIAGPYERTDRWRPLMNAEAFDTIGRTLLVYDLSKVGKERMKDEG